MICLQQTSKKTNKQKAADLFSDIKMYITREDLERISMYNSLERLAVTCSLKNFKCAAVTVV